MYCVPVLCVDCLCRGELSFEIYHIGRLAAMMKHSDSIFISRSVINLSSKVLKDKISGCDILYQNTFNAAYMNVCLFGVVQVIYYFIIRSGIFYFSQSLRQEQVQVISLLKIRQRFLYEAILPNYYQNPVRGHEAFMSR